MQDAHSRPFPPAAGEQCRVVARDSGLLRRLCLLTLTIVLWRGHGICSDSREREGGDPRILLLSLPCHLSPHRRLTFWRFILPPPLPRPAAFDFALQREAEEGADQDDYGEDVWAHRQVGLNRLRPPPSRGSGAVREGRGDGGGDVGAFVAGGFCVPAPGSSACGTSA